MHPRTFYALAALGLSALAAGTTLAGRGLDWLANRYDERIETP